MINKQIKKVIKLKDFYSFGNLCPLYANFAYNQKELKGNDYLKLYGALYEIADNNKDLLEEYGLSVIDILDHANIQDNALQLNDFEGYSFDERYNFNYLFLANNDIVMLAVYDNKKDRFIDFILS